ncbi:hypothetical protein [Bacillus cereus]|uniref:hypothetical protein n=1 Tax=Bacillus cereus TaxID=1396 RepID=UPI000BF5BD51|nr:hypothetical protein [Bacillus cereus]PEY62890.1 hypothetical protein CN356_17780 [Bacillus cereus]PFT27796.1 hypothetical protein COK61_22325 [Bacillus cereus]PFW02681.1 hypothetical protein COL12_29645 [Bacillus cereus]
MDFNFLDVIIDRTLKQIEREFQAVQGLILTEDDLKCLIYTNLMMIRNLSRPQRTNDGKYFAHSIHTELSWFDEDNTLGIKPDITLLEPEHLNIIRPDIYQPLPSKQCSFGGKSIIFELKFNRESNGITSGYFNRYIRGDFEKIQRLFEKLDYEGMGNEVFCYFVIFNKTNKICSEFNQFLIENRVGERYRIIYCTGNVETDRDKVALSYNSRSENILKRYSWRMPKELIGIENIQEYNRINRSNPRRYLSSPSFNLLNQSLFKNSLED